MSERINPIERGENIVADIVNKEYARVSKKAFANLGDEEMQNLTAYFYELKYHPAPWRSKDDEDLTQRRDEK